MIKPCWRIWGTALACLLFLTASCGGPSFGEKSTPSPPSTPASTPATGSVAPALADTPAIRSEPTLPAPTAPLRPTSTPLAASDKYPPPALVAPPDEQQVSWGGTVLLQWSSVGPLQENEYYHLHLERRPRAEGEEWYGDYIFTKDTEYRAEGAFLDPFHSSADHGQALVYWWVWVVHKMGQDENGKPLGLDLSSYSEERTLLLDPKLDK